MLNGEMKMIHGGSVIKSKNISSELLLDQMLDIRPEDLESIENATSTVVHWFVDCHYVRQTMELKTQQIFTESNRTHHIEALIEASFDSTPTKTVPTITSKLITNWRSQHNADLPYVCHNKSKIPADPNKIYGHFETSISIFGKEYSFSSSFPLKWFIPLLFSVFFKKECESRFIKISSSTDSITDLIVNGSTWIDDGDDYNLNIYCLGSKNFEYCLRQIDGPYILEGNETCVEWTTIDECQQNLRLPQRVLNVKSFTVLVIIRNPVSIERKVFVVNIRQPIILVATVVGTVVFTLCAIAAVVYCSIRCIRKKKR